MDENIIIPILVDPSKGLADAKKFRSQALSAIGGIGPGAQPGEIVIDVRVRNGDPNGLRNIGLAGNVAAQGLRNVQPGANAANYALLNLNRVIQDAPYGMMGITNNLNPLLEGFQRLRMETGSNIGALKALGMSLKGAGGLGLAVAAVSAALTFGSIGLQMWQARAGKAKAETKDLSDATQGLAAQYAASMTKLTALVGITQNSAASVRDKKLAIKAINQDYAEYLGWLGKEGVTLKNVAQAYDLVIDKMVKQAVVRGIQDQITKEVEKTAQAIMVLEINEKRKQDAAKKAADAVETQDHRFKRLTTTYGQYNQVVADGYIANIRTNAAIDKSVTTAGTYEANLSRLKNELKGTLKPLMEITDKFDELDIKLNKDPKPKKEKLTDYEKDLKRFSKYQEELAAQSKYLEDSLNKGLITPLEFAKQKYELLTKASKDFQTQFNQPANSALVTGVEDQAGVIRAMLERNKITYDKAAESTFADAKKVNFKVEAIPVAQDSASVARIMQKQKALIDAGVTQVFENGIMVPVKFVVDEKQLDATLAFVKVQTEGLKEGIVNATAGSLGEIGAGLGDAMSGMEGLGGIFNRVGTVIGNAMVGFGQELIKGAVTIILAKKAMKALLANPYTAIAAGIALVAVGTAIKNNLSKKANQQVGGFAEGGAAYGPMLAWVGESSRTSRSNPELFARYDQFKALIGSEIKGALSGGRVQMGTGQSTAVLEGDVRFEINGDKLVGVLSRTQARQGRSY